MKMIRRVEFPLARELEPAPGCGIIPRAVMVDPNLSVSAKAIYAYYCAMAGKGQGSFPRRKDIIGSLGLGRATYYRNFSELLDLGYLRAEQLSKEFGKPAKNTVEIIGLPGRFTLKPPVYLKRTFAKVAEGGITAAGYGFIDKTVCTDNRISIRAKALYAYYASFMEGDSLDIPRKDVVMLHLGINKETYLGAMKQLTALGYIKSFRIPDENLL